MHEHEKGYFTEGNSVAVVTGRDALAKDERLKFAMEVITRKLHEAVKEIEPTQDEWMEAEPVRVKELGFAGWFWSVEHDFVLARSGA